MDYTSQISSPIGAITLASNGSALTGLWFAGQKHFPRFSFTETDVKTLPVFTDTVRWLNIYFTGKNPDFTPETALRGTEFQKNVWNTLRAVPYGETITYGVIAKKVAFMMKMSNMSAQAVGGAVARNPISIIIPCHRVIGSNGSLTGYAGGLDRKRILLDMESGTIDPLMLKKTFIITSL